MNLKKVFGNKRIIAVAGEKQTGKTNNIVSLLVDYRKTKPDTPIYVYGMPVEVIKFLSKLKVKEISELSHLVRKKDCILIIDEFQKLKLNDRRNRDELAMLVDFVYHNNVYLILSTPNIREFNSVIGGVIERWLLKNIRLDLCVNGSQLKKVIEKYKGRFKHLNSIEIPLNKLLLINDEEEVLIHCPYIKQADSKLGITELF